MPATTPQLYWLILVYTGKNIILEAWLTGREKADAFFLGAVMGWVFFLLPLAFKVKKTLPYFSAYIPLYSQVQRKDMIDAFICHALQRE